MRKLVRSNAFRHHEMTQTESLSRTRQLALLILLRVQNTAQQVEVVP